jgi:hypothetical protein
MARGRMISTTIATSESLNAVDDDAALFFPWLVPHLDDFGSIEGSAAKLKGLVVPLRESWTPARVARAARQLVDVLTLTAFEFGGRPYLNAPNFDQHQTGLHKRTKSKYPSPESARRLTGSEYEALALALRFANVPGDSGKFPEVPAQENGTEEKRTEENGTLLSVSADAATDDAQQIPADLQAAADFWNATIVPAWGKPRVMRKTLRGLIEKYATLSAHMRDHDGWTLVEMLRRSFEKTPGLAGESWFQFKAGLFENNYLQKAERFWTGYYDSIHGRNGDAQRRSDVSSTTVNPAATGGNELRDE